MSKAETGNRSRAGRESELSLLGPLKDHTGANFPNQFPKPMTKPMTKPPTNAEAVMGYLEGRDWTSPTELGQSIWGKGHHSSSASPTCLRLVKEGKLERSPRGHYRLIQTPSTPS